ncbi:MAG: hypothetical protein WA667_25605 [Candidatus Nitrosopolaris sp.]
MFQDWQARVNILHYSMKAILGNAAFRRKIAENGGRVKCTTGEKSGRRTNPPNLAGLNVLPGKRAADRAAIMNICEGLCPRFTWHRKQRRFWQRRQHKQFLHRFLLPVGKSPCQF